MRNIRTPRIAVAAAAVLTLAACGNTAAAPAGAGSITAPAPAPSGAPAIASQLQQAYESVVAKVLPSVVQITTGNDLGSGIVFDDKGDIVTNAHVAGAAKTFLVRLAGSAASVPATLVGSYPPDDLAVIHLDTLPTPAPKPASFGDSAALQIGAVVLAMGNPLGLTGSVTDGIVSAIDRTVSEPQAPGSPGATLANAIQTSASINPGNSGGALVDLAGDVIGIPTLGATYPNSGGTGGSAAPGIGFAIPSNLVTDIAGQLVSTGGHITDSHRAALGVQVVTLVEQTGRPIGAGITSLTTGGPAAAAGVRAGEVITAVDGKPVTSAADLAGVLAEHAPGKPVPVDLADPDTGTTRTVTITLGKLPGS